MEMPPENGPRPPEPAPATPDVVGVRGGHRRRGDAFWFIDYATGRDTLEEGRVDAVKMQYSTHGWSPILVSGDRIHEPDKVFADRDEAVAVYHEHLSRNYDYASGLACHYRNRLEALRAGEGHGDVIVPCQAVS